MLEAEFKCRVVLVRERMESKEKEITGSWLTKEKMEKSGEFSKLLVLHCSIWAARVAKVGHHVDDRLLSAISSGARAVLLPCWGNMLQHDFSWPVPGNTTLQFLNTSSRRARSRPFGNPNFSGGRRHMTWETFGSKSDLIRV